MEHELLEMVPSSLTPRLGTATSVASLAKRRAPPRTARMELGTMSVPLRHRIHRGRGPNCQVRGRRRLGKDGLFSNARNGTLVVASPHSLPLALAAGTFLFLVAAARYPGGSQRDATAPGFAWADNYVSNLFPATAVNGAPNASRPWEFSPPRFSPSRSGASSSASHAKCRRLARREWSAGAASAPSSSLRSPSRRTTTPWSPCPRCSAFSECST